MEKFVIYLDGISWWYIRIFDAVFRYILVVVSSLAVQWLGLSAFTATDPGSTPARGTKIPQAMWCAQKKKKKKSYILVIYPIWSTGIGFGCWSKKIKHVFSLNQLVKAVPFTGMIFVYSGYLSWLSINRVPLGGDKEVLKNYVTLSYVYMYRLQITCKKSQRRLIRKEILSYLNNQVSMVSKGGCNNIFFYIYIILFIYLFLAALGLCCCAWVFL